MDIEDNSTSEEVEPDELNENPGLNSPEWLGANLGRPLLPDEDENYLADLLCTL